MGSKINVVIIEDDKTIREGYAFLIGNHDDLNVVGSFESFDKADGKLAKLNPDVILLDVEMPGTNGVVAIPKIISQNRGDIFPSFTKRNEIKKQESIVSGISPSPLFDTHHSGIVSCQS